jgi:thiol-disulfide isomerase/thioredoxin
VRFASEKQGQSLGQMYLVINRAPGKLRVGANRSDAPAFAVKLPPGRYTLVGDVNDRHLREERDITLEPGKPVDLGEIKLRRSPLARLFGQPAPAWHFTDARGISKDIQPADFKGKWVVLEFWGYWCGPCIIRGLPGWFDFAEDHAADRDKFVILTVCDPRTTDFSLLDEKLKPIVHRTWRGRKFPFPILLDKSGRMVKDYGIPGWPTAILIDPEGRVVEIPHKPMVLESNGCEDYLASKFSPLPTPTRIARALDRGLNIYVENDSTLAELMDFYSKVARVPIRLEAAEVQAAGVDEHFMVPLRVSGGKTLRAYLNLTLEPFGLTYVPDGDGLRIVRRTAGNLALSEPSRVSQAETSLVVEALNQKVTLEFHGETLKQLIAVLETKTDENFVLDPTARRSGAINPSATVTGKVVDEPLSTVLSRLLGPIGLKYVIRDEAIVFTPAR